MRRNAAVALVLALAAVAAFGQDRSTWRTASDVREGTRGTLVGTISDINEGANRFVMMPDDVGSQVTVQVDSVSTVFYGFGGVINGQPELFRGSRGFSNLRSGDRLEIRGTGRGVGTIIADDVTLLGRNVPASTTGVGDTRQPGQISTPTATGTTSTATGNIARIEGIVRQVSGDEGRIVIETDRREMMTIRGTTATPVYYRGDAFRIRDLEQGDRIRVDVDTTGGAVSDIRARTITVLESVQERTGSTRGNNGADITTISGRVTTTNRAADTIEIDNGRGTVRVDVRNAADPSGRRIRAADMQSGDRVDITGAYGTASDVFMASTVRFVDEVLNTPAGGTGARGGAMLEPAVVTIYGTVTETLRNAPTLGVRDTQSNRVLRIYAVEDLAIRTKAGAASTAERLNVNDSVVVRAFRDADGNYIAQTIRVR